MRAIAVGSRNKINNHNHNLNHNHNSQNTTENNHHHHPPNRENDINASHLAKPLAPKPTANPLARNPRTPLRQALKTIDHNVMMRQTTPLIAKSGNANMPPTFDRHNNNNNVTRPPVPKVAKRAPLTPRVAAAVPARATTPLARQPRTDPSTTPATTAREDLATPVSAFLNNNITPRSGSRKSRVDSTNTTPTGTPSGTPAPSSTGDGYRFPDTPSHVSAIGLGEREQPKRPSVTFSTPAQDVGYGRSAAPPGSGDSKFFFASEAKTAPQRPQLPPTKSSAAFVYANGETIPPPIPSSGGSAVGSMVGEERSQSKFFHANGIPELQASPVLSAPPPRPSSTVSATSRITSPPLLAQSRTLSPTQRPISPTKLNNPLQVAARNTPTLSSTLASRPLPSGRGQSSNSIVAARRASIEQKSHNRSASAGSPDIKIPSRRVSSGSSFEAPASATPLNLITNTLPISTPEESPKDITSCSDTHSDIQSPIKAGHSIEHMNKLAADARRERKVLDLEITNSSLAAINRTLEREMRKQTAELRRYRRLSRTGRLSIVPSTSRRGSSIAGSSILDGEHGAGLSDLSEDEEASESEESDYDSEGESVDDGSLSPGAMEESDLRHRARDEKRLQLDLSKHQQLLQDSMRMNQSLKRCMGWTEALIEDGKKALAYKVRVEDVQLGGRVLVPEEMEDEMDRDEGMSPLGGGLMEQARMAAHMAWGEREGERDSGIELDTGRSSTIFEAAER